MKGHTLIIVISSILLLSGCKAVDQAKDLFNLNKEANKASEVIKIGDKIDTEEKVAAEAENMPEEEPLKRNSTKKYFDPEYSYVLIAEGQRMISEENYTDAIKLFQKSLEQNPANEEAEKLIASTTTLLQSQRQNNTVDPQYSNILTNHGVELIHSQEYVEAIDILTKAVKSNPNNTLAKRRLKKVKQLLEDQTAKKNTTYDVWGNIETAHSVSNQEEIPPLEQEVLPSSSPKEEEKPPKQKIQKTTTNDDTSTPASISDECKQAKTETIPIDFYDGITLSAEIPTIFRPGEIYHLSGKITNGASSVSAFFNTNGDEDNSSQQQFQGSVSGKQFMIPVYFASPGEYVFAVRTGKEGISKAKLITVAQSTCSPEQEKPPAAPSLTNITVENGMTNIHWDAPKTTLHRIEFTQANTSVSFYVYNHNSFSPPVTAFKKFIPGTIRVSLWGATSDENSHEQTSQWVFGGEKDITAVTHFSRKENKIQAELTDSFTLGDTITIDGTTEKPLKNKMLVIDPNETIFEVDISQKDNTFTGEFTPKISGVHIFEINQDDMISLFSGASVPEDTYPLLPDFFDLQQKHEKENRSIEEMEQYMLNLVNTERTKRKLGTLKIDKDLKALAQLRARDMCERKYMEHTDPDGKDAGDYASQFNITVDIGENIGQGETVRNVHEGLMHSASHRSLIIKPTNVMAGFGFCWTTKEENILNVVQIFGLK